MGEVERAVQKVQGDVRREVLEVKGRVEEIHHESSVTNVRVEALASDSDKSLPPIVAKTSEIAGKNSEFAEILQSAQQCILEGQNEVNTAKVRLTGPKLKPKGHKESSWQPRPCPIELLPKLRTRWVGPRRQC